MLLDVAPGIGDLKGSIEAGYGIINSPLSGETWSNVGFAVAGFFGGDIFRSVDDIADMASTGSRITDPSRLLPAPEGPNPWSGNIVSEVTTEPIPVERFAGNPVSQWVQIEGASGTPSTLSIHPSNTAERISSSVIPVNTRIQSGTAAAVEKWGGVGGSHQIQILDDSWQEMLWEVRQR